MSDSTPPDLPPIPASTPEIPPGTPCPRCGYELTGLSPDGQCPECGGANRNALGPYRLANASPAFVKRLHLGATLTQVWTAIDIAYTVAWGAYILLLPARSPIVWGYMSLFYLCTIIFGYIAWWLVSSPDPSNPSLAKRDKARRVFRILLIADLGFVVSARALQFAGVFRGGLSTAIDVMAPLAFSAAFIASIVYIRSLARRIPSDRFHRRATLILRVSIATVVLHLCANPLIVISMALFGSGPYFGLWGLVDGASSVAMFLPYFLLLHFTRRELKNIRARM